MKRQEEQQQFCVIMAGGIGSRFWPFSRNEKPKQFLDFFGTGRSLLQTTVDRFLRIFPQQNIIIVTNSMYKDIVLEQLPSLNKNQILCEPIRRNTAPCIAYAVAHIRSLLCQRNGLPIDISDDAFKLNANIVVAPCDHLIINEDRFLEIVNKGLRFVQENDVLVTLGIKPTRPETGYGYIQVEDSKWKKDDICRVKTFTEKPNREIAEVFFASDEFLWNSGIFIWNLQTIQKALDANVPAITKIFRDGVLSIGTDKEEKFINSYFQLCPNISIDYGVLEKSKDVYVIPSDFGWSDLGTWGALYEITPKDDKQNVILHGKTELNQCTGNIISVTDNKVLVMDDLNDLIVVETENAILICKKENEQQIKQLVSNIELKFNGKYN